jgi:NNP family nitrate/nitrite transporter-like MFS transporter
VPFINRSNVGSVAGIVGAGGNVGGMLAGFLFKSASIGYGGAFTIIGLLVVCIGFVVFLTPFDTDKQTETVTEMLPNEALVLETVKIK